jgi:hypothetical protein
VSRECATKGERSSGAIGRIKSIAKRRERGRADVQTRGRKHGGEGESRDFLSPLHCF